MGARRQPTAAYLETPRVDLGRHTRNCEDGAT